MTTTNWREQIENSRKYIETYVKEYGIKMAFVPKVGDIPLPTEQVDAIMRTIETVVSSAHQEWVSEVVGKVGTLKTPPMDWEFDDRDGSQYCKGCNYSPKEGCHCATKNTALDAAISVIQSTTKGE